MNFNQISATELIEVISSLSGVTLQIHKNFKPIYVTEDYARLYGFDGVEDFLAMGSIMDLIPDDMKVLAKERYEQIITTGVGDTITLKTQRVDGQEVWVKLQDRRLKLGQDDYCVLTVLVDITAEVKLSEEFEQLAVKELKTRTDLEAWQSIVIEKEKQTALGHLLAGMSHLLNTPLGNIRTSATTVESTLRETLRKLHKRQLKESEFIQEIQDVLGAMDVVDKSALKASRLIKNVKFMVSEHELEDKVTFQLKPIIEDAARLFSQNDHGLNLTVSVDIAESIYAVSNPNTWMQVISILCENVLQHAMVDKKQGNIDIEGRHTQGRFIIRFSDNGRGIPENERGRIFEAFYSTQMSNNHGLGLALAYNLVSRSLDGAIKMSEPKFSQGTSFEISLPGDAYLVR
jgi:PAS domain S-box-containing protein